MPISCPIDDKGCYAPLDRFSVGVTHPFESGLPSEISLLDQTIARYASSDAFMSPTSLSDQSSLFGVTSESPPSDRPSRLMLGCRISSLLLRIRSLQISLALSPNCQVPNSELQTPSIGVHVVRSSHFGSSVKTFYTRFYEQLFPNRSESFIWSQFSPSHLQPSNQEQAFRTQLSKHLFLNRSEPFIWSRFSPSRSHPLDRFPLSMAHSFEPTLPIECSPSDLLPYARILEFTDLACVPLQTFSELRTPNGSEWGPLYSEFAFRILDLRFVHS